MRLDCPNCGAQYEIDAALIPDTGRDVQCSNCGHGWFEPGRARRPQPTRVAPRELDREAERAAPEPAFQPEDRLHETARANAIGGVVPNAPDPGRTPAPAQPSELDEMDAILRALDDATAEAPRRRGPPPAFDAEPEDDIWASEGARPRPLDAPRPPDDVMDILRSEAAREQAARRAEAEAQARFEDQGEFDMDPPPRRSRMPVDEDLDWLPRDEPPFAGADEDTRLAAASQVAGGNQRQSRFPDIEEVSSYLGPPRGRRGQNRPPQPMDAATLRARKQHKLGRKLGFSGAVAAAVLGLGIYAQSGTLASRVPALAGPISGYVNWVDGMRVQLDGAARDLARILRG